MVLLSLEYVSETESHLPSCYILHESQCQMSTMEKHLQTDRYVMERCATNYSCTSDSGTSPETTLWWETKLGKRETWIVYYELYCGCKYKDDSWLCMRFVDPHGRNTDDFVTSRRWYLLWGLRFSQWCCWGFRSSGVYSWVVAWVISSPCLQGLLTLVGKGTMVLQNVWSHLPNTTVSDPRRPELLWLIVCLFCRVKAWGLAVCA